MRPLIADGGSLTVLRRLASFAWGEWRVDWPESVPDEQRPQIEEGREFGYVYDMPRQVGRMGRRFVRSDVSITGADYGPDGVVLPYSGFSDVEQALDEAAGRTDGDAFFEREIGRGGLNGLVPFEDFDVGDAVDVGVWSVVLPSQIVAEVQEVTEPGVGVVDWRVRVSGDLVPDDVQRKRQNLELERQVWQERRERMKADSREAQVRRSAVAGERSAREADMASIRGLLGGPSASDASLLSQLAAVNAQIINMGEKPPPPGLLNSYMSLNTLLWEQQQEINRMNQRFQDEVRERQRQDALINARQDTALQRAQTAIDNEEKYRTRFAAGAPTTMDGGWTEVSEWFDIRSYSYATEVRLRKNARGFLVIFQTMMSGLSDMRGHNVNHRAGQVFSVAGGINQNVQQWLVLYQLYDR